MSINRFVAVLTPLVFAPAAGYVTSWAAQHLPGPPLDSAEITALFVAGATIAFGKAALWLRGWQLHEQRSAGTPVKPAGGAPGAVDPTEPLPVPYSEVDYDADIAFAPSTPDENGHVDAALLQ